MHVSVRRNYLPPRFGQPEYTVDINEKQPLDDVILQMHATDTDKVSIRLKLSCKGVMSWEAMVD